MQSIKDTIIAQRCIPLAASASAVHGFAGAHLR